MLKADRQTKLSLLLLAIVLSFSSAKGQTTSFTYQGRLTDGGTAANGNYDLQFALFDSASGGSQIGTTQTVPAVTVAAGVFTVQLDFGPSAFPGANRFLEIRARSTGTQSFTTLSPRQQINSTPYAVRSLNASTADTVTVNGLPSGSGNYIQNLNSQQANSNFNISGNGTAGGTLKGEIVNADQEFRLRGSRFLYADSSSTYGGIGVGSGGANNTFFGSSAGLQNGLGASANTYFGAFAGQLNINAGRNSFFGYSSGARNTGEGNTFMGFFTGDENRTGMYNTLLGVEAEVGTGDLTNATALGAFAQVDQSNSLVLGSVAGVNGASVSAKVGIGTTTPQAALDVTGAAVFRPVGAGSSRSTSIGSPNSETGITIHGPTNRADVRFDGSSLKLVAASGDLPPALTSGIAITTLGNVGIGTTQPGAKLGVVGDAAINGSLTASGAGEFGGTLKIGTIESGFGEGMTQLCRNGALKVATCSSSSLRYKKQVTPYTAGLDLIRGLRPISFTWKADGTRDVGLGAEDVAKIEPLLVTHNDKGEIEGVKYDHLNVVLINAIKQQQIQIDALQREVRKLRTLSRRSVSRKNPRGMRKF